MVIDARSQAPFLSRAIAPNISAVQLAVPISLMAFVAWTLVGLLLGLAYRAARLNLAGGGGGGPHWGGAPGGAGAGGSIAWPHPSPPFFPPTHSRRDGRPPFEMTPEEAAERMAVFQLVDEMEVGNGGRNPRGEPGALRGGAG